jgi:phosphohistidine phosphatase
MRRKIMDEHSEDSQENSDRFVILLRHGIAEEKSADKPDDDRALTGEGNTRMKQNARGLAAVFPKAEALYSSPLVRAIQTGLWVTKGYRKKLRLQTIEALRHEKDPAEIIEFVRGLKERRIILVGHEPHLSRTMAVWTGMAGADFELKKGGCYGLRVPDEGPAVLEWILPPRILRKLE